jgi:microcystin-dependent protein
MYYDTTTNTLYYYNGTTWISATGGGGGTGGNVGDIKMSAAASPPAGWLVCDGSAISRTTYSALYSALGSASSPWGQGDGSSTFNLPDLRGRTPIGAGTGSGLTARSIGQSGGEEAHTLGIAEIPSHTHQQSLGGSISTVQNVAGNYVIGDANTSYVTYTGGGGSHNNVQPFAVINYVIKY